MARRSSKWAIRWLLAAGIGITAGTVCWWQLMYGGLEERIVWNKAGDSRAKVELPQGVDDAPARSLDDDPAWQYACAFQRRDFDRIIDLTWWMQERLALVGLESPDAARIDEAVADLHGRLAVYSVEGNQLRPEGIEDQYVLTPDAALSIVGKDAGRDDLAKEVGERTWIRVTYPDERRSPRNEAGRPIRAMTVGINVTTDGFVLKAGVIGNLECERDLIKTW